MIHFTVDTNPLPKARPRFSNGHAYTPQRTQDHEAYIAYCARLALGELFFEDESISITLHFKRKGKRLCDIDNLIKACLDALNGTAWRDDTQVREIHATLEYGHQTGQIGITLLAEKAK